MTSGTASTSPGRELVRPRILLPKEHGAYGQLLFPIATALVVGDRSVAAVATAVACAAAFVGHESVLTLLGHRGARAGRERRRDALVWLAGAVVVTATAGAWALVLMPPASRASVLLPVGLATVLMPFIWFRVEHSTAGEIVAAVALSSGGFAVARAGDVALGRAVISWLVFAVCFVVATLAVRSTIACIKNARAAGVDQSPAGSGFGRVASSGFSRIAAFWLATACVILAILAVSRGWIPATESIAPLPVCALAVGLSMFPPHPRHLRAVGWSLVTATAVTAILLAVAA